MPDDSSLGNSIVESIVETPQTLMPGLATRCHYCYGYYIKYVITTLLHCYYVFINHHHRCYCQVWPPGVITVTDIILDMLLLHLLCCYYVFINHQSMFFYFLHPMVKN